MRESRASLDHWSSFPPAAGRLNICGIQATKWDDLLPACGEVKYTQASCRGPQVNIRGPSHPAGRLNICGVIQAMKWITDFSSSQPMGR